MHTNDRETAEALFNANIRLAYYMANRSYPMIGGYAELDFDDVRQICLEGLWAAAMQFDPARRSLFSSYACRAMQSRVISCLRMLQRHGRLPTVSIDSIMLDDCDCQSPLDALEVPAPDDVQEQACQAVAWQKFLASLPEKMRRAVLLHGQGLRQQDIGKQLGVSQVTVSRLIRRAAERFGNNHQV
jgi:RNA polymerase sigma factor (sigma-70 family)